MSPLPPPSGADPPAPYRPRDTLPEGWVPAHDDSTPRATDWRARKALDRTTRQGTALEQLRSSVDALTLVVDRTRRVLIYIFTPFGLVFLGGAAAMAWQWVSTFHH